VFVAAHLVAVLAVYGAALAVGDGWVEPPMPVPNGSMRAIRSPAAAKPLPAPLVALGNDPVAQSPDWLQLAASRDLQPRWLDRTEPAAPHARD
jgi:hypothetical protein